METNSNCKNNLQTPEKKSHLSITSCIPSRYVLTLMSFWSLSIMFAHRVCLNVAIVAMVNSTTSSYTTENSSHVASSECPRLQETNNFSQSYIKEGSFNWSPSTQGIILGSYFYGYVFTQVTGGKLTDLTGAKWLSGAAIFLSAFITLVTPIIAELGALVVTGTRLMMGLAHGVLLPNTYTIFSKWAPIKERSTLLSICTIGTHFGSVFSMPLTGYLCAFGFAGGWPSAFYVLGIIGFACFVFWSFLVYNSPDEHPRISNKELEYIHSNLPPVSNSNEKRRTPWRKVLTSGPVWALTAASFAGNWSFITLQTKLPAYLEDVLHFPIQENGFVNALPSFTMCVSIVATGYLSDYFLSRYKVRTTTVRKSFESIALFGPAVCMAAVPAVGCDGKIVVILLTLAMTLYGFYGGGEVSVTVDMAPDFAGKIFGVSNAVANIPGFIGPYVAGLFLQENHGSISQWSYIFYISVGFYIMGALAFLLFASSELQPWSTESEDQSSEKPPYVTIINDKEKS